MCPPLTNFKITPSAAAQGWSDAWPKPPAEGVYQQYTCAVSIHDNQYEHEHVDGVQSTGLQTVRGPMFGWTHVLCTLILGLSLLYAPFVFGFTDHVRGTIIIITGSADPKSNGYRPCTERVCTADSAATLWGLKTSLQPTRILLTCMKV